MKNLWYGRYKWLKRSILCVMLLGIISAAATLSISSYIIHYSKPMILTDTDAFPGDVDCILVLGAGIKDGKPSLVLRDRLDKAIELYQAGVSDRMLMSGDNSSKDYDEVQVMKDYAVEAGIPAEYIFTDHAGFSTYESLYRARDIFEVRRLAIVTQPYHSFRAVYIADKLGLEAFGTPSEATEYRGSWILEAREKLARTKDFFNVILQPKPTYLGEPIPISGKAD